MEQEKSVRQRERKRMDRQYEAKVTSRPYFKIGLVKDGYGIFSGIKCIVQGSNRFTLNKRQADSICAMLNDPMSYDDFFSNMTQEEIDSFIEEVLPV